MIESDFFGARVRPFCIRACITLCTFNFFVWFQTESASARRSTFHHDSATVFAGVISINVMF